MKSSSRCKILGICNLFWEICSMKEFNISNVLHEPEQPIGMQRLWRMEIKRKAFLIFALAKGNWGREIG